MPKVEPDNLPPIGLVAGQGRLPVMTAQGIRAAGRRVACIGLSRQYDRDLPQFCDVFTKSGITHLGRWVRVLRQWGVSEAVMVGRVKKTRMYSPLLLVENVPDWRFIRVWYRALKHDRRSATLLAAVADELSQEGITLIDSTKYIPQAMADEGLLTRRAPGREQMADIEFAWPLVKHLNELDIGQGVIVRGRDVVAVEAIEGTDAMIRRAGELCRVGGWTLIKTAKAHHDMRFDVPTVGPNTIENMHLAGGSCLVVEAGKVILAERQQMLELADRYRIAVVGRR